jgi:hypothetical protein
MVAAHPVVVLEMATGSTAARRRISDGFGDPADLA